MSYRSCSIIVYQILIYLDPDKSKNSFSFVIFSMLICSPYVSAINKADVEIFAIKNDFFFYEIFFVLIPVMFLK